MGELGGGATAPGSDASLEDCLAYCAAFEEASALTQPMEFAAMPDFPNVTSRTETIRGADGNDIDLYLHMPNTAPDSPRPCILHIHGGGMVLMTAADPGFVRWRNTLADEGFVVVGVEFRNGGGKLGNHPFPAGLNDCASALQWNYHASQEELSNLPPHIISVNELDPLRDEGLAFFRKLQAAGNSAVARTVHGTHHAGDLSLPDIIPDIYSESLRSLCGLVRSL